MNCSRGLQPASVGKRACKIPANSPERGLKPATTIYLRVWRRSKCPLSDDCSPMDKVRFEAELVEGHKGVTVVLVPFDPEKRWSLKPVRLDARRHGWLVAGSANGIDFEGYIG